MSNINNSTQIAIKTNSIPAILRTFDIAEASVASVNLGRVAVPNQVALEARVVSHSVDQVEDNDYFGVVEINHSENIDAVPSSEELEESVWDNNKDKEVRQRYLRSETEVYKPTGNEPYPNLSPLLAPN